MSMEDFKKAEDIIHGDGANLSDAIDAIGVHEAMRLYEESFRRDHPFERYCALTGTERKITDIMRGEKWTNGAITEGMRALEAKDVESEKSDQTEVMSVVEPKNNQEMSREKRVTFAQARRRAVEIARERYERWVKRKIAGQFRGK